MIVNDDEDYDANNHDDDNNNLRDVNIFKV